MNDTNEPKRRGRPTGSNSFERIRLKDLLEIMGENSVVPVSTVWLREQGLTVAPLVNITVAAAPEQENDVLPPIQFKLETFEDEQG